MELTEQLGSGEAWGPLPPAEPDLSNELGHHSRPTLYNPPSRPPTSAGPEAPEQGIPSTECCRCG